jgi:outer membrane receptor for ferrienterochelin and colicin
MEKILLKRNKNSCVKKSCFVMIVTSLFLTTSIPVSQPMKSAFDQEADGDLSLADLFNMKITSASLRPQELREVPATTYIFTEVDFKMYGYRDLKDILRNAPGIEYSYPNSHLFGGQRGFSSFWELTKLRINGREVNTLASSALFVINQFPLNAVKRVEIIQGPASVLYGPDHHLSYQNLKYCYVNNKLDRNSSTSLCRI